MNTKVFEKILNWGIPLLVFLLPIFFLPVTVNFYDFNKNLLLYLFVTILTTVWGLKAVLNKDFSFQRTALDLPILAIALAFFLSMIIVSPNKSEALLNPGAGGTILVLTLLYFLITNNPSTRNNILKALMASAGLLALIAIYQFFDLGGTLGLATGGADWLKSKLWTPAGAPLSLATFLAAVLVLSGFSFWKTINSQPRRLTSIIQYGLSSVLIATGLGVTVYQILPGRENALVILPYLSAWSIAIESFKRSPFLGVGPENFISAFNRFRPINFNQYDFWNFRFTLSSSYPLHLLTTSGILGFLAFLWLVLKILKNTKIEKIPQPLAITILVCLLLFFFLPPTFLLLFTFFLLLAIQASNLNASTFTLPPAANLLGAGILTLGVLSTVLVGYFGGQAYASQVYFKKSLDALVQNRGLDTYNYQITAIGLNPQNPDLRRSYSQTNFALANSLAAKKDLTDQDRVNISQLIQQAIREAKIATTLNPTDSTNWENLALIYRNLINFAQGADQWAVASSSQAVATDPFNPRLRLDLGGLYFALGSYEEAVRQFRNCVDLKPDFANGYYNLAAAYREQQKYPEAYQAMQLTLNLIPADSPDWQKAKNELDELAKKLPVQPTPSPQPPEKPEEALTEPQPLPSPVIKPPLELPAEASPETQP